MKHCWHHQTISFQHHNILNWRHHSIFFKACYICLLYYKDNFAFMGQTETNTCQWLVYISFWPRTSFFSVPRIIFLNPFHVCLSNLSPYFKCEYLFSSFSAWKMRKNESPRLSKKKSKHKPLFLKYCNIQDPIIYLYNQ